MKQSVCFWINQLSGETNAEIMRRDCHIFGNRRPIENETKKNPISYGRVLHAIQRTFIMTAAQNRIKINETEASIRYVRRWDN